MRALSLFSGIGGLDLAAEAAGIEVIAHQYAFEFPRTVTGQKYRANRLKALGNAVVPAQAASLFKAIAEIERMVTD